MTQPAVRRPQSPVRQSGMALVITLILLSVTLIMAVAFLAVSRRERNAVTIGTDAGTAKFAADSALNQAESRIVSQILTTTNPYVFSLLVSTNYVNGYGFVRGVANPTNVNYDYLVPPPNGPGGPLAPGDFQQNIANLFYYPRPPVFYGTNDFRYYLDLNRNGRYDTNGWVTNVDNNLAGLGTTNLEVGDPEWIGILEHPDAPHGPNNPFIARYCYIAVPANSLDLNHIHNQALDAPVNSPTVSVNPPPANDGYWRDQGVGAWEINLAAFLADLDTNRWDPYPGNPWGIPNEPYLFPEGLPGNSVAFDDARSLVAWRYANNYKLLASADTMFGTPLPGKYSLGNEGIDTYSIGLQTTFDTNFNSPLSPYSSGNYPAAPWVGAVNTNDFFSSPSDLYNTNKSSIQFATNLLSAGTNNSTHDRYTFYRLLAQLGTDTQPQSGQININYQNAVVNYDFAHGDISRFGPAITNVPVNITVIPNMETNFINWQPHDFFTAAADKLLHAYTAEWFIESPSNYLQTYFGITTNFNNMSAYGLTNIPALGMTNEVPTFGITNIPVYVNGTFVYTPAVNRLLQLAANIYDATTNTTSEANNNGNYPSVFRPIFWVTNQYDVALNEYFVNVYIKGYQYIYQPINRANSTLNGDIFLPPIEVNDPSILNLAPTPNTGGITTSNVWGVPWIIGAKKGLPNLNQLEVENCFFIERLLDMQKRTLDPRTLDATNQMYIMAITNYFGFEDRNSYLEPYNNEITAVGNDYVSIGMTWTNAPNIPAINNPNAGSTFGNFLVATTNYSFSPWAEQNPLMFYGTNAYGYTINIPGASFVTSNSFETAQMNSSSPTFLNTYFITNATFVYYYGTRDVTLNGYTFNPPCFIPTFLDPSNYMDFGTPPLPQMILNVTNRVQAYVLDNHDAANGPYILDYVQLGGMQSSINVNQAVADETYGSDTGLWSTNFYRGDEPFGVNEQILVSQVGGAVPIVDNDNGGAWNVAPVTGVSGAQYTGAAAQQAFFSAFLSPTHEAPYYPKGTSGGAADQVSNLETSVQLPYTAMRTIVQRFVYEANDPLVHYMASDLLDYADTTNNRVVDPPLNKLLGSDDRYSPWGTTGKSWPVGEEGYDGNADNLSYKDPLVWESDNWDFPTNKFPNVGWLGRVHRGTPWQSVFLKSTNLLELTQQPGGGPVIQTGIQTWQLWTGNAYNSYDAYNTAPVWDRMLFDLFTAAPDDDAMRGQLNVNIGADNPSNSLAGLASWSALLSGTLALSNNGVDRVLSFFPDAQDPVSGQGKSAPTYNIWTAGPLGSYPTTNSPMWKIVTGINNTRNTMTNIDGLTHVFEHAGDILSVPQLSDGSPFLNSADVVQQQGGISDEMYEWLPQQILSLLTVSGTPQSPPRYVVYCYGQSLKPAPNGIVTSGPFFGMCTNYQVVSESASRAIIRVENTPTPGNPGAKPHIVVEQYNPMPPD